MTISKILEWMFNIGVVWMMIVIISGALGAPVTFVWILPSLPLMFIPKALWVWGFVEDPFDKL